MYDLRLSDEQLAIRDTVRDFVAHEIKPFALRPETLEPLARQLPMTLLDKAAAIGLRTLALYGATEPTAGSDNRLPPENDPKAGLGTSVRPPDASRTGRGMRAD